MKKSHLTAVTLVLALSSAYVQASSITTSCSNNQFALAADFGTQASCRYSERLTVNGIESFEQIDFSGNFTRQIPLELGDQANVSGMFQCSTPNGSFSATRTNQTIDGCSGESEVTPVPRPTPDPILEPPVDEFDPAALQEFQLELANLLALAAQEVSTLQERSERFATRSPRFAARILQNGIVRLQTVTEARVDRLVNNFADRVEPSELLGALEQFNQEFDSIIDLP